jgi:hypothetical protein
MLLEVSVLIFSELIAVTPFKSKAAAFGIGAPNSPIMTRHNVEIKAGRKVIFFAIKFAPMK